MDEVLIDVAEFDFLIQPSAQLVIEHLLDGEEGVLHSALDSTGGLYRRMSDIKLP